MSLIKAYSDCSAHIVLFEDRSDTVSLGRTNMSNESMPDGNLELSHQLPNLNSLLELRRQNAEVAKHVAEYDVQLAKRISGCAADLWIARDKDGGSPRIVGMYTCDKHLLCMVCEKRRQARAVNEIVPRVESLHRQYAKSYGYHVTLTVRGDMNLSKAFRHLVKSSQALYRQRHRRQARNRRTESMKIIGALNSVEISRNPRTGLWTPHIHAFWLADAKMEKNLVAKEWKNFSGNGWYTDVEPVHPSQVGRIISYATKGSKAKGRKMNDALAPADRAEAYRQLRSCTGRLPVMMTRYGELRGRMVEPTQSEVVRGEYVLRRFSSRGIGEPYRDTTPAPESSSAGPGHPSRHDAGK